MLNRLACGILSAAFFCFIFGLLSCTTKRDIKESQSEMSAVEPEQSFTEEEYAKRYSEGYQQPVTESLHRGLYNNFSYTPRFPWPPPQASDLATVPIEPSRIYTLGDLDEVLKTALQAAGYVQSRYYALEDGFALVTQMEQIHRDGTPVEPGRWNQDVQSSRYFTLKDYFRALFTSVPGRFRIIVFVVTDIPYSQDDTKITGDQANAWFHKGVNKLPPELAQIEYTDSYQTDALIYEFEKLKGKDPVIKLPSGISGLAHLQNSGILNNI